MDSPWLVKTFILGDLESNTYILYRNNVGYLIDCGAEPEPVLDFLEKNHLSLQAIFLTHAHVDHIQGLTDVQGKYPCEVYIHKDESSWVGSAEANLSFWAGTPYSWPGRVTTLQEGPWPLIEGGNILHTPGHSPGGVTFFLPEIHTAFTGDLLFSRSVGRTDFPGGSSSTLTSSLVRLHDILPISTRLLPGHGPETTLGEEILHNPYLSRLQGKKA